MHCTENEMWSNLFLNVHWPLSQGAVPQCKGTVFRMVHTGFTGLTVIYDSLQVVLLSATMPADVLEVTKKFMRDPIRILVKKEELTLEGIKQFYINVEREVRLFICNALGNI